MSPVLIWFFAGLALILLEFVVPGVILVFFGVAAWIVAILAGTGLVDSTTWQLLVFIVASLVLLFGLRRLIKPWFMGEISTVSPAGLEEIIGKQVKVLADIPGGQDTGKVELKGAEWRARSLSCALPRGALATVAARDGLVLVVVPLQAG